VTAISNWFWRMPLTAKIPGRKTDVSDAAWIADLLAHGLIRSSFVPEQEIQELRERLRTRKQLTRQQSSHILGCRRPWRAPASSWTQSSLTSSARVGGR
jgi:hypothetical protein